MTEIRFYQLQLKKLEQALTEILAEALGQKQRVVVKAGSTERLEWLNTALWTQDPSGFLPHGSRKEGHAESQPIWLTLEDENPNQASMLVLTDGTSSAAVESFSLCCELFDGNDGAAVAAARERWKAYKEKGHTLAYYK